MRGMKRGLAALLSVLLVLTGTPLPALASGQAAVHVSLTRGNQVLASRREVPIGPEDTLEDVLVSMHHDASKEVAFDGDGYIITLWDIEIGQEPDYLYCGYYINQQTVSTAATQTPVFDGDEITLFFYDGSYDVGVFDTNKLLLEVGSPGELTLYRENWQAKTAVPNRGIHLANDMAAEALWTTDANGEANISFDTAGVYVLSADPGTGEEAITMPWCVVTVKDSLTARDYVDFAAQNLTWRAVRGENIQPDRVTEPLRLPKAAEHDVTIGWSSSDNNRLYPDCFYPNTQFPDDGIGYITRPAPFEGDAEVTLTATVSADGAAPQDVVFSLTIPKEEAADNRENVSKNALLKNIEKQYANRTDDAWKVFDMAARGYEPEQRDAYLQTLLQGGAQMTENARNAIVVAALGGDPTPLLDKITVPADPSQANGAAFALLAYQAAGNAQDEKAKELVQYLLDHIEGDGWGYGAGAADVDTTAMAVSALAAYYEDGAVQSAVDTALDWLETQKNHLSIWNANANSTAMAVLAYLSMGKAVDLEGLLYFALSDNSGFGYKSNIEANGLATEQAFRALAAYENANGAAYNIYADAKNIAKSVYKTGGDGGGGGGSETQTMQVTFTLRGDTVHGTTAHSGSYPVWIDGSSVSIPKNGTVYDAFVKTLNQKGYGYEGAASGYVTSITTPEGMTLRAGDNGPNSGWKYQVNGTVPEVGLKDYRLREGDSILWYFTDDYTKEEDGNGAAGGGTTKPEDKKEEEKEEQPNPNTGTEETEGFLDVAPADWFAPAVAFCVENGLFNGLNETHFGPAETMTRGMAVAVLGRFHGEVDGFYNGFQDVADTAYYKNAVAWAAAMGYVSGVTRESFVPDDTITREQLISILYRYAKAETKPDLEGFNDAAEASAYARPALSWAVEAGILSGRGGGLLAPKAPVTRAEAAQIFMKFAAWFMP